MFAAVADGASIHDLILDAPVIDIQSDIHYDNLLLKAHNQLFIKPFEYLAR